MSNRRKGNNPREKDSEWQERVIQVRRVTKVCKGGKKISFRAVVVLGNEKGKVGVGVGKAADVIGAVKKAVADGKRHVVSVTLTKNSSVPHISNGVAGAAKVFMRPAAEGCGVIAGGSVRTVLELAGVKNILTKQLGSNNPLNNACATVDALKNLRSYAAALENRKVLA